MNDKDKNRGNRRSRASRRAGEDTPMNDKDKNSTTNKSQSSVFDKLTGRIGKISALIIVLGTLVTGVEKLTGTFSRLLGITPAPVADKTAPVADKTAPDTDKTAPARLITPPDLKNCFTAKLDAPENVKFSEWRSMKLTLRGENKCPTTIIAHITYRAHVDTGYIEPPFCPDTNNVDCWDQSSIDKGPVEWQVTTPRLNKVGDKLTKNVTIKWKALDSETIKTIRTGTAVITILDDDPPS